MHTRLLWADADPTLSEVCARYFTQRGFDVRTSSSALDCLLQLGDFRPEVVVLDENLLWGGAAGLIERLRDDESLVVSPQLVLLTGGGSAEDLSLQTGLPPAHCLPKPFHLLTVLDRIRATLDVLRDSEAHVACCDD
jgi:DNA-binding response OmpR family regulator